MKNLFFKEMKLAMHPLIWFFIIFFPVMCLIPSYPLMVAFIYVCSCYPILFLGANKGQQSNDIYFSCLLPVKKKEVVKARILTVLLIQIIPVLIMIALRPVAVSAFESEVLQTFNENIKTVPNLTLEEVEAGLTVGFSPKGTIVVGALALLSFVIFDLIYFTFFYKNGRSIALPTLFGMLVFSTLMVITTIVLPLMFQDIRIFLENSVLAQVIVLAVAVILSVLGHMGIYKIAAAEFGKVDL